jgi:hypothetical protein
MSEKFKKIIISSGDFVPSDARVIQVIKGGVSESPIVKEEEYYDDGWSTRQVPVGGAVKTKLADKVLVEVPFDVIDHLNDLKREECELNEKIKLLRLELKELGVEVRKTKSFGFFGFK